MYVVGRLFIATCILTFFGLVSYTNFKLKELVKSERNIINSLNEEIEAKLLKQIEFSANCTISGSVIIEDKNGIKKKFNDFFLGHPVLILRVPESSCSACVDPVLDELAENSVFIASQVNIAVLISTYSSSNTLSVYENKYNNRFPFFKVCESVFENQAVEKLNVPFFFMANNNHNFFFLPDSSRPKLTENYFRLIIHYYL